MASLYPFPLLVFSLPEFYGAEGSFEVLTNVLKLRTGWGHLGGKPKKDAVFFLLIETHSCGYCVLFFGVITELAEVKCDKF